MKVKRIKYRFPSTRQRLPYTGIGRRAAETAIDEALEGQVQGLPASAGEERAGRALAQHERVQAFWFRLPVGGARNTPGWKELDYLVQHTNGLYYLIEVDSAFTHRQKANADILHDAILINELEPLGVFPKVYHVDNERDLADQAMANETFRRLL